MNFFIKNWGFLGIILIMAITVFVGIITKSWEAWESIGSIGTFLMAIATFITLWWYQKEKQDKEMREILERIIYPLRENLKSIIENIPKGEIGNWQWQEIKKHPSYLTFKKPQEIVAKIEDFTKDFEKFKNLYHQRYDEINKLFFSEIFSYFSKQSSPKAKKVRKILSTHPNTQASVRNWFCSWQVGGKGFSTNFFEIIFFKKSLKEFVEESKNDPEILNKEASQMKCYIKNKNEDIEDIEERDWNEIADCIKKKLEENETYYKEYFGYNRQVYDKARKLKKELEDFIKRIK